MGQSSGDFGRNINGTNLLEASINQLRVVIATFWNVPTSQSQMCRTLVLRVSPTAVVRIIGRRRPGA
jgi:hypothetical protein